MIGYDADDSNGNYREQKDVNGNGRNFYEIFDRPCREKPPDDDLNN